MESGQMNIDDLTFNIKEMLLINQQIKSVIENGQDNYK